MIEEQKQSECDTSAVRATTSVAVADLEAMLDLLQRKREAALSVYLRCKPHSPTAHNFWYFRGKMAAIDEQAEGLEILLLEASFAASKGGERSLGDERSEEQVERSP